MRATLPTAYRPNTVSVIGVIILPIIGLLYICYDYYVVGNENAASFLEVLLFILGVLTFILARYRVVLSKDKIEYRAPFAKTRTIKFSDLTNVVYGFDDNTRNVPRQSILLLVNTGAEVRMNLTFFSVADFTEIGNSCIERVEHRGSSN